MFITRVSIHHPVFASMVMLALMVVGIFSYARMGVDQFPDIDLPVIVVSTTFSGASPETMESDITRPIENAVNTIAGIDTVTSESYEGHSVVVVQFDLDVDAESAAQDVRDRVSRLEATLPDNADAPQIMRFNPDDQPIISLAVSSKQQSLTELTSLAEELITKRLNIVSGVGQTTVVGGSSRQIAVMVEPEKMQALSISVLEIQNAIRRENQDIAAGNMHKGIDQRLITVKGRIKNPEEFDTIIVARRGGAPVYLSQVAKVRDQGQELESRAFFNGQPALGIDVVKIQGSNTVEVAAGVRRTVDALAKELAPMGVELSVSRDNSRAITSSLHDVQRTLIEGGLLTIAIVFLFLNSWRSTVITALTLPISIAGTFAVIYFLGFTLNMMTLMALSLAIGILIDDAIVVRENITRHMGMGKSHKLASLEGTTEIGLAVLATTFTIVAVFLPVAFMGGIIGRFFMQFGVTVSVAVLISLFVSFTLDPMLSSVWYDPSSHRNVKRGPIGRFVEKFDHGFERLAKYYQNVIGWSLRHRITTIVLAGSVFFGSLTLVPLIGAEFVPKGDQGKFEVQLKAYEGASLDYMVEKVAQVEQVLRTYPEVSNTYSTINTGRSRGTNEATVHVDMVPLKERSRTPSQLAEPLRTRLSQIAGLTVSVNEPGVGDSGGNNKPLQINVLGESQEELKRISKEMVTILEKIQGAVEIETSMDNEKPTLAVRVRRDVASDLEVSLQNIGDTLRPLMAGDAVSEWNAPNGETYDVIVRLPEDRRQTIDDLKNLIIPTGRMDSNGIPVVVNLDQVADFVNETTPNAISRKDLSRQVLVSANVSGRPIGDITREFTRESAKISMPAGYRVMFGGDAENMADSISHALQALALAVIFIYLILASQFGSFLQPLAIMTTLPLSLIGVLSGLLLTGSTLNIFSIIGFIMLMGLVTKNAILLVDFSNQRRREGATLHESLIDAGKVRLRPIIMTTLAMIFGMLPLALGLGEGGAQRSPMAHAVIGGLISSTLLTLVFVPVIITYLEQFGAWASKKLPKSPEEYETDRLN